jgi:hypothetical protein
MNSTRFGLFVLAVACAATCLAAATGDSIIGFWRAVKSESSDPDYRSPNWELEIQFRDVVEKSHLLIAPESRKRLDLLRAFDQCVTESVVIVHLYIDLLH